MAIRSVANQIQAGEIECGLAVGVESMSNHSPETWDFSPEVKGAHAEADDCKMPMGWTSENVAADFAISREKMDAFAARSHQRAAAAQSSGRFDAEILPITVPDGQGSYKTVSADDGIRASSTPESLAKIKAAFPQWPPGNTTGGNASQLTDGAAGVLLMRRSMANKLGKKVVAKYVACSVSGLAPRIMGIGPSLAIPRVLELTGIDQSQVDLFEINEAFSSMAVYCQEKLAIASDKLNVNGGACALGHPLGAVSADGARLWSRLLTPTLPPDGRSPRRHGTRRAGTTKAACRRRVHVHWPVSRRRATAGNNAHPAPPPFHSGMGAAGVFIRED